LIPFSSGAPIVVAEVLAVPLTPPILLGFGSFGIEPTALAAVPFDGAFTFPVPFVGRISNLEVGAELLALLTLLGTLNSTGLTVVFSVIKAHSSPNNGKDHVAQPYLDTGLSTTVTFGGPSSELDPFVVGVAVDRTATNLARGSVRVEPGDRIGIRVTIAPSTTGALADVSIISFNASIAYEAF